MLLMGLLAVGWIGGLNVLGRIMGPPTNALLSLILGT